MKRMLTNLAVILLLAAPAAHAGKLVCWTDDKGQRACGDRVPPQYAKKERQILDSHGRVIGTQDRQKTPEEIAEMERKAAAAEAEQERFKIQEKYDRYLLQTFANAGELEGARDARLRALEAQMTIGDKANADNEKTLKGLRDRVDALKQAGKEPDPKLAQQVAEFEKALADGQRARQQRMKDHAEIKAKFALDIERFNLLKSGRIQVGQATPAASDAATQP
jgi:hypothetical protein